MASPDPCPAVRDLQQLACVAADAPAAEPLRRHLGACGRCAEIVELLRAGAAAAGTATPALPVETSGTWRGGRAPALGAAPVAPAAVAALAPSAAPLAMAGRSAASGVHEILALLAPAEARDELGRLGSYRIFRALGSGATGVVFLAEDVTLQRRVALKVMRPVADDDGLARQRFLREARAAAVIDHEHIVTIYQVGEERGVPYLAMKLLEGETLEDRLRREGQLLVHDVLRIGLQVAQGLAAAHARGLIHRDIKPANVFVEAGGRAKIVDFGLARAASDDQQLTRPGTIVGTPAYMSPEQARGLRVDHRSDLFSLGCLLYRMCAGRPPFKADDTVGLLTALTQDHPPPVKAFNPAVPDVLAGLIAQLLAKLPEGRPQTADAVVTALTATSELVAAAARDPAQFVPPSPARRARRAVLTVMQMLALAGLAWCVYTWGPAAVQAVSQQVHHFRLR